ncbi:hypothetical protein KJ365_10185 [Glaciecola sp. XM2]|uniref:hypothetical protein n=1 Tax=Glaciecola sp. XM2 TaxID=1914931 RepID=UPI001BDF6067|nr:hypothetical protein [Glaciecola sp. XM2]MBT1451242.1 hypothetical protein [Glaciecola sp. XM2]
MQFHQQMLLLSMLLVLISGCSSAVHRHAQAAYQIDKSIDCSMAQSHIDMLKKERASTVEKIANGVATILPSAAIVSLFTGEFSSRKAIATGEFDQMLYMKIASIESQCMG